MTTEHDPVCGMAVNRETAKATREFAGTTYCFCSTGCAEKFALQPDEYCPARPMPAPPASPFPILRSAAGSERSPLGLPFPAANTTEKDPVCGMLVDPKTAAGEAHAQRHSLFFLLGPVRGTLCGWTGEIPGCAGNGRDGLFPGHRGGRTRRGTRRNPLHLPDGS